MQISIPLATDSYIIIDENAAVACAAPHSVQQPTHTHTHTHTFTHIHTHTHTHSLTRTNTHLHTHSGSEIVDVS